MNENRIQRVVSIDGTEIAGRVHGQGPPLVLVNGVGDGEARQFLVPLLSERFTCYSMSLRGRGLSRDHPDHSPERLVQDVAAFVDSIGEPAGLVGHSRGAALALRAAAHASRVSGVAAYEPHVPELHSEDDVARVEDAVERMSDAAGEGRLADAVETFFERIALVNDEEMAAMSAPEAVEAVAPNIPALIRDVTQWEPPRAGHVPLLERITVPVLLLHGSRTAPFYTSVVRHLAEQLADVQVGEIAGAAHLDPLLAPEPVAEEVVRFFDALQHAA